MEACGSEENIMNKSIGGLIILVLSMAVSVSPQQSHVADQPAQSDVVPLKAFARDQRFETVSGDPTKPGAIYVIRIHSEAGFITMPHTHPEDEHIVVVKGTWSLGMGDRFSRDGLQTMELGSYGLVPKKMTHFGQAKTDNVIHVYGIGPFTTHWVIPMYELTGKGVLYETSGNQPGVPTSTNPPDCFRLKLGAHVRGSYGDGIVIGAQCTPGELTQYRIEKADGERFWAQGEELKIL
jgi:hypothetical protein